MAYIVQKGQTPTAETALQNISVPGWRWASGEFGKLTLPSSISFSVPDTDHTSDAPFNAILCPDTWDFFEPIEVKVFTSGRDLTKRTVTLTAYPVSDLYGKLNLKLKEYAPQCYFNFTNSAKDTLSGDTEGWSLRFASITKRYPVFSLFGLEIVPNGGKATSIDPEGAEVSWDGSVRFVYDCTASLPDVTVGEILYIACYSQGLQPQLAHVGITKEYGAKWWCKNLNKTPNATFVCAINKDSDNYFVRIPPVDGMSRLAGEGRYDYYLWMSWDSDLPPAVGLGNYWRGANLGSASTPGGWDWYSHCNTATNDKGDRTFSVGGTAGGSDTFTRAKESLDAWELSHNGSGAATYRYVLGTPWRTAYQYFSRLCLYFNANSANPMPSVAPTISRVMVNLGPYPAEWTDDTLNVDEYLADDPFGLVYMDPLDFPAGTHTLGEISGIAIGDEVHQSSKGVARYGSGNTEPQLGWAKEGRSLTSEDVVTLALNGSAYSDGRLGTIEAQIRERGTFPDGLVISNRPAITRSLRMALKLAMVKDARRISWSSSARIREYYPVEGLLGYFTASSAHQEGRSLFRYEGTYYRGFSDFFFLTTQKMTFLPYGGSADVVFIGRPNESIRGGGYSGFFPNVLRAAVLTIDSVYGAAVHGTLVDGEIADDIGGFLESYGDLTVWLNGKEQTGWELFEDVEDDGQTLTADRFMFKAGGLLDAITSDVTTSISIFNVGNIKITKRGYAIYADNVVGEGRAEYSFALTARTPVLMFYAEGPVSGGTPSYTVNMDGETITLGNARRVIVNLGTPLTRQPVKDLIASSYVLRTDNNAATHLLSVSAQQGQVSLHVMYLTFPKE